MISAKETSGLRGCSKAMLFGMCLIVATAVAILNRNHGLQQTIYRIHYLRLAKFFRADIQDNLIGYLLWGYPWLLSWLPRPELSSVVLQIVLAVLTVMVVYVVTRPVVTNRRLLTILCVLAVPWYSLASVKLPDIYAASFGVLCICFLTLAARHRRLGYAVVGGLCLGASLNFRSDFVMFLALLPILALVFSPSVFRSTWKQLMIVVSLALVLILPWGFFRLSHGVSFGITSTHSGWVLLNSLGFPNNKWGIVKGDQARQQEVDEAFGPGVPLGSEQANALFRAHFIAAVRSNPLEFGRKALYNFFTMLRAGFYILEVEPYLSDQDLLEFEVLKEQLKSMTGILPNKLDIQRFKDLGLWNDRFSLLDISVRQWLFLGLPLVNVAFSSLFLILMLLSVVRILFLSRKRLEEPLYLFSMVSVCYVVILLSFSQYEPRQANILYLLGLPIVLDSVALSFAYTQAKWIRIRGQRNVIEAGA